MENISTCSEDNSWKGYRRINNECEIELTNRKDIGIEHIRQKGGQMDDGRG